MRGIVLPDARGDIVADRARRSVTSGSPGGRFRESSVSFFRLGVFPPQGLINHGFASQPRRENAEPARSHGSGRIGRPEKATALGESSLDLVVPAPRPPARGVKRARVLSAFFPSPFSEKVHIYRF